MICFCWHGFPQYGARCVAEFVRSTTEEVAVIATRPSVPVKGMDELAGCPVHWIDLNSDVTIKGILGEIPRVLTVPGWSFPFYNRFRDEVRLDGGRVIAGCDNDFTFSFKEILKAIRFRLFLRNKYDGFWVPGKAGRRLMRFYGAPAQLVYSPSYSADVSVFSDGEPLEAREKRILFVGQFIDRKNVLMLCEAFLKANVGNGWTLELCGCGVLRDKLPNHPNIVIHDFVQPEALAAIYRKARIFCLPSKEEHWGLVVHEAALSGCVLLLSNRIGAAADFLEEGVNGYSFSPFSIRQMTDSMQKTMRMSDCELITARARSLELASTISTASFAAAVREFSQQ